MHGATTSGAPRGPGRLSIGALGRIVVPVVVLWAAVPVSAAESTDPATTTTSTTTTSTTTTSTTTTTPPTTSAPPPTTSVAPTTSAPPPTTLAPTTTLAGGDVTATTSAPPIAAPADVAPSTTLPAPQETTALDDAALDEAQVAELLALQHQFDELVAEEAAYLVEYEVRLQNVEQLDADLALLARDIALTELRVERARSDVDRIIGEQRENEAWLHRTQAELDTAIDRLRQQAVDSFIFGGTPLPRTWDAIFDPSEAHRVEVAQTYANVVVEDQQVSVDRIRHLEEQLEQIRAEIQANRSAAEQARRQVEILERQLEAQRDRVQQERDRAEAERSRLESVLAEIRRRKAAFDERLQTMVVESDNITRVLARAQGDQQPAARTPSDERAAGPDRDHQRVRPTDAPHLSDDPPTQRRRHQR